MIAPVMILSLTATVALEVEALVGRERLRLLDLRIAEGLRDLRAAEKLLGLPPTPIPPGLPKPADE